MTKKIKEVEVKTLSLWGRFECWVNSWFPGFKTYLMTGLGVVGSAAAVLQSFVTGLPLTKFISGETMAIASAVLFTLSFWFAKMGDRVKEREED